MNIFPMDFKKCRRLYLKDHNLPDGAYDLTDRLAVEDSGKMYHFYIGCYEQFIVKNKIHLHIEEM